MDEQENLEQTPVEGQEPEKKADAPDPVKAELEAVKAERDAERARASEQEQAARYWHGQAKESSGTKKTAAEPEEDKTDFLELVAKGPRAVREWMAKEGVVTRGEVDQLVNNKAAQLAREATLTREYPELANQKSPFFLATAKHYQEMTAQGVDAGLAMQIAAERAELEEHRSGKKRGTAEERTARARAAGGDTGKRSGADERRTDGVDIPMKEEDIQKICDGFGITREAYNKRAELGVAMARR